MASGLGLATEVGLDGLFARGVLGGDIQELPHCAQGLMLEHVDERLTSRAVTTRVRYIIGFIFDRRKNQSPEFLWKSLEL